MRISKITGLPVRRYVRKQPPASTQEMDWQPATPPQQAVRPKQVCL